MESQELIPVEIFCRHHGVTVSFIGYMEEAGRISITVIDEHKFISAAELAEAETMARLHIDLQINPEGVDVALQLLARIKKMNEEMTVLKSRLRLYETVS